MARPGWTDYFLGIAKAVSKRGDCTRSQVGAVIWDVNTHQLVSTGYNGVAPGDKGCLEGACPRGAMSYDECPPLGSYSNCISTHAEKNAITWLCKNPHRGSNANLAIAITREPCDDCRTMIKGHGFRVVFWPGGVWLCRD